MSELIVGRLSPAAPASVGKSKQVVIFEHDTWSYFLMIPILYLIGFYVQAKKLLFSLFNAKPATNCIFVDGISVNSKRMKEGAARWPSLNTCYNFVKGEGATGLHRTIDAWWMNIRNAQAVRNRLKIAKAELRIAVEEHAAPDKPVRVLSLAAGTAQGVIEVAAECSLLGITVEILLIDLDETALRYARDLAHRHGVKLETITGNVLFFNRLVGDFKADVVEMMGLIDYLKDGLVIQLVRKIRLYMNTGGHFFTCHIHPNAESYFLRHVVDWDMLYRTRDALEDLITAGGFLSPSLKTEPHGIHSVVVAKKM